MRQIEAKTITQAIAQLCQEANYVLGDDVLSALKKARQAEGSPLGKEVLDQLLENARIAREGQLPLCQDCGTAIVFLEVGQEVHIVGGDLNTIVEDGVHQGYEQGFLRKSIVRQPFSGRVNTNDNTPPVIHTELVPGNQLKITVMPKGSGAENMSRLVMLPPSAGEQGIVDSVVATVSQADGNPCPPLIIGLGIGATAEKAMIEAKKALLRPVGSPNVDPEAAQLERGVLAEVNALGIGPLGFGGSITALAVQAKVMPSHMASLPLAVNLQCHSARHQEVVL